MKQIFIPEDTDKVKVTDVKIIFQCNVCHHDWACYLERLTPLSTVCIWCLQRKFEGGENG
jgi:hypothetical protein